MSEPSPQAEARDKEGDPALRANLKPFEAVHSA